MKDDSQQKISKEWDLVIQPKRGWFDINLVDIWRYRELIFLFVKRDFVVLYKQTIMGPLWYLVQPLSSAIVYTFIFGKIAKLPTDGIPPILFYLSGTIGWTYFSSSVNGTSNTFIRNAGIFGKVYFPRLIIPISNVISNLGQFSVQLVLFLLFYAYFYSNGVKINPNLWIFYLPFNLIQMAILGLGMGILVSSLTTKYKDLVYLMTFAIQLWMYATPIVYPSSIVPETYKDYYMLNPMVSIVESIRYGFLSSGGIELKYVILSWAVTLFIFFIGMISFHRVERNFMDTV
jgi:lipopolysaccharide transport system permease protein